MCSCVRACVAVSGGGVDGGAGKGGEGGRAGEGGEGGRAEQ